ncbi:hypothetical protein NCH01_18730 [Neoasaia chiangmaiensis]|uniref:Alkyl hydroperoxide reductase C n=1 Tax=Neoasaia chiangmaiensis TaxID=320497 RepID=A0A1U9KV57_9PROT|nr:peroxiredoxin [Neoasaia chiangmaiensis]AQS89500.1 peroxiredoxin [Neoasaia chiangmaiensis]GEN15442.1 hypothetical protein NCH01_18730 [Neoasaia chiangmaiensis]
MSDSISNMPATPMTLRIGDEAPDFTARSTKGQISLSALRGRWVIFFSHPADFTPVCTSEFVAFSRAAPDFEACGATLIGLSIDSLPSHLAWIDAIRTQMDVRIPFPVIEDPSMAIARAYGMLDSQARDSATVRATYILDPDGIIQAIFWYPMTVGRAVSEILRTLRALQRVAPGDALTPEGWQPGNPVLSPGILSQDAMPGDNAPWFHQLRNDAP